MPLRMIREGILDSRRVNKLSEPAEILYRRLMSVVDDYGRFEADLDVIRARCFSLQMERWPCSKIEENLIELTENSPCFTVENGESRLFTVENGESPLITVYRVLNKNYLQINNFGQRTQSKPRFPSPPENESNRDPRWKTVSHGDPPLRARDDSERTSSTSNKTYAISKTNLTDPELQEVADGFDRHLKHDKFEPRDLSLQTVMGMNGQFSLAKFRSNHAPYCEFHAAHGWGFSTLSFLGWIRAGMPPPPPVAAGKANKPVVTTASYPPLPVYKPGEDS